MEFKENLTAFDRQIWEEELNDFVPERVFDAHTHLWSDRHAGTNPDPGNALRLDVDFRTLDNWSRILFPGRQLAYLLLGTPVSGMEVDGHNEFIAAECAKSPVKLGSMITVPEMTAGKLAETLEKYHFRGLKPYRFFAHDPAEARIADFLPEHQMEVADSHGLTVTLHMSRFQGIGDPLNLQDLQLYTAKYPNIRWILAHCARAFNAATLENSIRQLRDLPNIWYDTSAVCDDYAHFLLLKYENRKRILFGTDNIAAGSCRGKYISWGKGWCLFRSGAQPHCNPENTLVVYEQLRAQKHAADMAGLSTSEIEDIFYGNAARLFALP